MVCSRESLRSDLTVRPVLWISWQKQALLGEEEGTKPRKVLMSLEQFEELLEQGR